MSEQHQGSLASQENTTVNPEKAKQLYSNPPKYLQTCKKTSQNRPYLWSNKNHKVWKEVERLNSNEDKNPAVETAGGHTDGRVSSRQVRWNSRDLTRAWAGRTGVVRRETMGLKETRRDL